jgi:hypothetical protein
LANAHSVFDALKKIKVSGFPERPPQGGFVNVRYWPKADMDRCTGAGRWQARSEQKR